MELVKVAKASLQDAVKKNRGQHQKIFDEAIEGYRKQTVKLLEEHIQRIKEGKVIRIQVSLPMPENHINDYDRVLKMLEMSIENEIEIGEDDFSAYVMDDWHWKRQFLTSASSYSMMAADALGD